VNVAVAEGGLNSAKPVKPARPSEQACRPSPRPQHRRQPFAQRHRSAPSPLRNATHRTPQRALSTAIRYSHADRISAPQTRDAAMPNSPANPRANVSRRHQLIHHRTRRDTPPLPRRPPLHPARSPAATAPRHPHATAPPTGFEPPPRAPASRLISTQTPPATRHRQPPGHKRHLPPPNPPLPHPNQISHRTTRQAPPQPLRHRQLPDHHTAAPTRPHTPPATNPALPAKARAPPRAYELHPRYEPQPLAPPLSCRHCPGPSAFRFFGDRVKISTASPSPHLLRPFRDRVDELAVRNAFFLRIHTQLGRFGSRFFNSPRTSVEVSSSPFVSFFTFVR
jgi:hypothetical protein